MNKKWKKGRKGRRLRQTLFTNWLYSRRILNKGMVWRVANLFFLPWLLAACLSLGMSIYILVYIYTPPPHALTHAHTCTQAKLYI